MNDPRTEGEVWWLMTADGVVPIPREPRGLEYATVDLGLDMDAFVDNLLDEDDEGPQR